ncbi:MAG TPA: hypothetical protein DEQ75_04585, partial [Alphaproteobacteria bacterium]|nr:hypothetical protein [Alphaproteobacteria bacterium]
MAVFWIAVMAICWRYRRPISRLSWGGSMAEGQKTVALFGATGSIGSSTLDLVLRHPERFRVSILTGGRNVKLLSQLALRFRPDHV